MQNDPGISHAIPSQNTNGPLDPNGTKHWWNEPRWSRFAGQKPPMTPARARAIHEKREWEKHAHKHAVEHYASARELAIAFASGSAKPFLFDVSAVLDIPSIAGRVRAPHLHVIAAIACAVFGWNKRGLIGAHRDIGTLCGLGERQTGTIVRELVAWGLFEALPVFAPYGVVCSRRANAYVLGGALAQVLGRCEIARAREDAWQPDSASGLPGNPEILTPEKNMKLSGNCLAVPERSESPAEPATIDCRSTAPAAAPAHSDLSRVKTRPDALPEGSGAAAVAADPEFVKDASPYLALLSRLEGGR